MLLKIIFQKFPARPVETCIAILVCIVPIILIGNDINTTKIDYEKNLASQKSSSSASKNDFSRETIHDSLSASYCYEIKVKPPHPKYQTCLDTALLCKAILDMPSNQYYDDCKNRGWSEVFNSH